MVSPWITADMLAYPESPYADLAIDYASYILYRLTGEKYPGVMSTVEGYVYETNPGTTETTALQNRDRVIGVPASINHPQRLYLRGTPVHQINDVWVDGELIDPSEYALFNKRFLKMRSGMPWGYGCKNGGVTVDYTYGMLPPKAGILACITLANEVLILLGEGSDGVCRIPERVRSVSREGISFDMIDPQEFLDDGRTGIWEIDMFIRTANPARAKKQPRIVSPNDARRYRR